MSVSDCCWHWHNTVLTAGCQRVLSICLSVCLSIYCLHLERLSRHVASKAIHSACSFITIFVTKYRTLLHVADVRTR